MLWFLLHVHTWYLTVFLSHTYFYNIQSYSELFPDSWCDENLAQPLQSMSSGHWCPFQDGHWDFFLSLGSQQGHYWKTSPEVLPSYRRNSNIKLMVHTNIITQNSTHKDYLDCIVKGRFIPDEQFIWLWLPKNPMRTLHNLVHRLPIDTKFLRNKWALTRRA